jgi:hypothetical protein
MKSKAFSNKVLKTDPADTQKEALVMDREKRFNDKFLNQCKKIYCTKHKIEQTNLYENVFSTLNKKILNEIEISKKNKESTKNVDFLFKVRNYDRIYKRNSGEVLKMIKSYRIRQAKDTHKENILLREVKNLDLKQQTLKKKMVILRHETLPKLYDHDDSFKFQMSNDKNMREASKYADQVQTKLRRLNSNDIINCIPLENNYDVNSGQSFSKNSYLASLNLTFKNPII